MIQVTPSPTADTRTCDYANVSRETLLASSRQHIDDVGRALMFFNRVIHDAAARHDHDKISDIDGFHADFVTGFAQTGWWDRHRTLNRHHLNAEDGIPTDVNLIDVLDFIADCVMAGMARSGQVRPLELPDELLRRAFVNTVRLLVRQVVVVRDAAPAPDVEVLARRVEPREPTEADLVDPLFGAVWQAIKGWDISRHNNGLYAGPTGNDVCTILDAIRQLQAPAPAPEPTAAP
jgi:hypothetical protein